MKDGFRRYLEEAIGEDNAAVAFSAFDSPASVSVRFNRNKTGETEWFGGAGAGSCGEDFGAQPVSWCRDGFILDRRPDFTLDPWLHCGAYYVQDSSAMFVGEVFRRVLGGMPYGGDKATEESVLREVRVLDLCAAPGGKTTDLASSLREICGDRFLLVANEVMSDRASVLSENVARWGDPNVMVTKADPAAFAALEGFFDIILADVPCSGEGMFRKDEQAVEQWSEDNVELCRGRQRRIVADVLPALKAGGIFIYSTCTFNKYENDGNVEWMCGELGFEPVDIPVDGLPVGCREQKGILRTRYGFSLVPGFVPGEGQYCSALRRCDGPGRYVIKSGKAGKKAGGHDEVAAWFDREVDVRDKGEVLVAVPRGIAAEVDAVSAAVRTVRVGCTVGTVKGRDIVPSADLALSTMLSDNAFPRTEVDLQTALAFLHRDTICLPDAPKGYIILTYKGLPIGFVKNLGTRCNNLHPQNRRIRMDVR